MQQLMHLRYLDAEKLKFMSYQFEELNMQGEASSLIQDLRTTLPQKPLGGILKMKVEQFLQVNDGRAHKKFKELLGLLNSFLCFLRNEKAQVEQTVWDVCSNNKSYKLDSLLTEKMSQTCPVLLETPIENILDFYEIVENKYFDQGVFNMKPDFCH
mmetsp:Transcript_29002/g.27965  ORF Transcript_29002/g.27965 Transcript_29002/m.27965 type:complete len:156 (+) Transcript_29002:1942-2409(+)